MVLRTVQELSEIRVAIRTFNTEARASAARSLRLLVQTSYWVYELESRTFGPSKFVGYVGMNFATYERAHEGLITGMTFDGTRSRVAIEKTLGRPFQQDGGLAGRLRKWGEILLGTGVFEGVDTSKWQFVTLPAERNYWAVVVNPDIYRVEDVVKERETALWTVKRGDIRAGDRMAIWKAKGTTEHRGVIALGEVVTAPAHLDEDADALRYWHDRAGVGPQRRVRIRHVRPPAAPLWLERDTSGVLAKLSVARATGGGVYHIEPEQWNELVNVLGGWLDGDEEDAVAEAAWEAQTRARRQGFAASPAVRKAVEEYAMRLAEEYYSKAYKVRRVGKPYDLYCMHRSTSTELYVEVKGTTTAGEEVLLTPNEVRFAREHVDQMALFVHSGIVVEQSEGAQVTASAGKTCIWEPWDVDAGTLKPVGYVYTVPVAPEGKDD